MENQTKRIQKAVQSVKFEYYRRSQNTEFYICKNTEDGSYYDIEIKKSRCNDYEDGVMRVIIQAQKAHNNYIGDAGDCLNYYKVYTELDFKFETEKAMKKAFGCAYHSYLQNKNFADQWMENRA
tara:strand:+ start:54 stop:425 length:372 start_codon:yes stop_codon:yes gene_type:complete